MSAENMTFGIEIECGINRDVNLQIGGYHHGTPCAALPSFEGRMWKAETDGSLYFRNRRSVEFVSPILKGAAGLDNIRATCAQIKAWGGQTNRTCGLHIHVGVGSDVSTEVLRRLYRLVGRFENALYSMTGTPERRESRYCNPIKTPENRIVNWDRMQDKNCIRRNSDCCGLRERYSILNINNLISDRGTGCTVEFRVFSGSLNPAKIAAWIQVCLSLVQMAQDGWDADWDINPSVLGNERGETIGDKHVHYMCKFMWRWPSRRDRNYGELGHTVFTRKAAQRLLRQLAVRHDTRAGSDRNMND